MAPAAASTKVITGKIRLSYAHLFEAKANFEGAPAKYSTVILVPKSDTKTVEAIKAAQRAALENGKASKFNGKIPPNWTNTFRDGDEEDLETAPEKAGHWFMTVSNSKRPGIVDENLQPILDPTAVYSGCYARVSINAFAFNANGNKGVSFGLNHVQFLEDGEPLGGVTKPENDFAEAFEDSLL